MRIQLEALGDALIDHVTHLLEALRDDEPTNAAPASTPATSAPAAPSAPPPGTPNLAYLREHFAEAVGSFHATVQRIVQDNPVDLAAFQALVGKAGSGQALSPEEQARFAELKSQAQAQGKAIGAVMGFFLKYRPYPMLAEIRARAKLFQPVFGPILVVEGDSVREVLSRHHEFTVDPYGAEMKKSMSPAFNGGFDSFILSTDDDARYDLDKALLTSVVAPGDAAAITDMIHAECRRRLDSAVADADAAGTGLIDVVRTSARFVPVYMAHHYLGVPAEPQRSSFELTDEMLSYYGDKVAGPDGVTPLPTRFSRADGSEVELPDSALAREDGVIPDEQQVYDWIVATFQHFFNNVQKDVEVQARGVRAYRELLVYILREIAIRKPALQANPDAVPDNMLTRLLRIQLGLPLRVGAQPLDFPAERVSDLRIAENVMGTIVGAIAGQEEATCRVIDSMIRLKEGDFAPAAGTAPPDGLEYGSFEDARQLALNIQQGKDVAASRQRLLAYVNEALRLQPQGEVLLRMCVKDGARIADSRPIRAGTLVFAAHGSAMQDLPQADTFVLGRPAQSYLQYGYGRHKCLGQYVSPILIREALAVLLALEDLRRPAPRVGDRAFPLERRFGRFQLDDNNLYATTFTLAFGPQASS